VGGGVIDDAVDTHNAVEFRSDPLPQGVEMSGLFSGHVDFVTNKKDFDFEVDVYELIPQGKYVQLSEYWTRASYINDHTRRKLLEPGKRQQFDFSSIRLMSRQLQAGSRVIAVISVIKESGRQINYGTGKDVSDETIQDAAEPLEIQWFGDSSLTMPVSK
jgi:predicted acyl esterase